MLELLINPRRAEKKPWEMFFIGLIYATLSMLIGMMFLSDPVLSNYAGIFVITFCVIFSMPFIYYTLKLEERKDINYMGESRLLAEHGKAIKTFLWLFLGFVVAFAVGYMVIDNGENLFKAQIETFCQINQPNNFNNCVKQYGVQKSEVITGAVTSGEYFFNILMNNVYVMIFTLILSLAFGAGAIFILVWNASVIASAIAIFVKSDITHLIFGLSRYMIHGLPEISAYFVAALSGGLLSMAVMRHDTRGEQFWVVMLDSIILLMIAVLILVISALIEVFITPKLF